jgi:hypothetical protein
MLRLPLSRFAPNLRAHRSLSSSTDTTTHFGFKTVEKDKKEELVGEVFSNVAEKYGII